MLCVTLLGNSFLRVKFSTNQENEILAAAFSSRKVLQR